jgi:hypothetical protein
MNSTKKIKDRIIDRIIVIPICGFANRLKFLASVDSIAKKLKVKNVNVLWKTTADCNISAVSIFKSMGTMTFIEDLPPREGLLYYGHIHLNDIMTRLKHEPNIKSTLVLEGGHEHKHTSFSDTEFLKYKMAFFKSIVWSDLIMNRLDEFRDIPSVGIHYRHTVKITDDADINANPLINFAVNSPFSEFEKIIKRCKVNSFFISNSLYHKKYINENYNIQKVRVLNLADNNDRSKDDSMINSVVEFVLLSRCDVIIGSYYSSFSDEASYFNLAPKVLPLNDQIFDKKELCEQFIDKYHSSSKPMRFEDFLILNPNIKLITTIF